MTKIKSITVRKRQYRAYNENALQEVIAAIKAEKISINKAAKQYKISKGTLINRLHDKHTKSVGSPLVLSQLEEEVLLAHVITVSEWGFPFDKADLCQLTKLYLDKSERKVRHFKDNMPTRQWATRFLNRHKNVISNKKCQNLKRSKADLKPESMQEYFDNLKETLTEEDGSFVPACRIFNYDETNLSDDPGAKRCIFKRGVKYPERIMDSSKSCISLMFCGSADGKMLPPYVVYKSKHLYTEWMGGGPLHTRYNRSKNGWFDAHTFRDWFEQMFLPYIKKHKLNEHGKVVIIGDNLSSHFCPEVLQACKENNIVFVCLPKNSTHLSQPLDVAFYRPLKGYWKVILDKWKKKKQKTSQTVTKEKFPKLLNELYKKITGEEATSNQLVAGFTKTGIFPYNPDALISRLPKITTAVDTPALVSESVLDMLKDLRYSDPTQEKQRRTKLNIEPGKSIAFEDLKNLFETRVDRNAKVNNIQSSLRKMVKRKVTKPTKVTKSKKLTKVVEMGNAKKTTAKGNKTKGTKLTKGKKPMQGTTTTKNEKKAKWQILTKATFSDSDESESNLISKRKNTAARRKTRIVMSDTENDDDWDELACKHHDGKRIINKTKGKKKYIESDSDPFIEETNDTKLKDFVRPSISQVNVGDYVLIEYIVGQCKKHYIGIVKTIQRDVLRVVFLIHYRQNFTISNSTKENIILPTQIVNILPPPSNLKDGKLIFSMTELSGFDLA